MDTMINVNTIGKPKSHAGKKGLAIYRSLFGAAAATGAEQAQVRAHLATLSDEILQEFGYTEAQIANIRTQAAQAN